ncbi:hypothetical protein HDU89_007382 [Geranomyces variabilis]|nr:hypothetical protein HDU89_007382 [Geranomyces variabilis]
MRPLRPPPPPPTTLAAVLFLLIALHATPTSSATGGAVALPGVPGSCQTFSTLLPVSDIVPITASGATVQHCVDQCVAGNVAMDRAAMSAAVNGNDVLIYCTCFSSTTPPKATAAAPTDCNVVCMDGNLCGNGSNSNVFAVYRITSSTAQNPAPPAAQVPTTPSAGNAGTAGGGVPAAASGAAKGATKADKGTSPGLIAGIVIGVLALVAAGIYAAIVFIRRKRAASGSKTAPFKSRGLGSPSSPRGGLEMGNTHTTAGRSIPSFSAAASAPAFLRDPWVEDPQQPPSPVSDRMGSIERAVRAVVGARKGSMSGSMERAVMETADNAAAATASSRGFRAAPPRSTTSSIAFASSTTTSVPPPPPSSTYYYPPQKVLVNTMKFSSPMPTQPFQQQQQYQQQQAYTTPPRGAFASAKDAAGSNSMSRNGKDRVANPAIIPMRKIAPAPRSPVAALAPPRAFINPATAAPSAEQSATRARAVVPTLQPAPTTRTASMKPPPRTFIPPPRPDLPPQHPVSPPRASSEIRTKIIEEFEAAKPVSARMSSLPELRVIDVERKAAGAADDKVGTDEVVVVVEDYSPPPADVVAVPSKQEPLKQEPVALVVPRRLQAPAREVSMPKPREEGHRTVVVHQQQQQQQQQPATMTARTLSERIPQSGLPAQPTNNPRNKPAIFPTLQERPTEREDIMKQMNALKSVSAPRMPAASVPAASTIVTPATPAQAAASRVATPPTRPATAVRAATGPTIPTVLPPAILDRPATTNTRKKVKSVRFEFPPATRNSRAISVRQSSLMHVAGEHHRPASPASSTMTMPATGAAPVAFASSSLSRPFGASRRVVVPAPASAAAVVPTVSGSPPRAPARGESSSAAVSGTVPQWIRARSARTSSLPQSRAVVVAPAAEAPAQETTTSTTRPPTPGPAAEESSEDDASEDDGSEMFMLSASPVEDVQPVSSPKRADLAITTTVSETLPPPAVSTRKPPAISATAAMDDLIREMQAMSYLDDETPLSAGLAATRAATAAANNATLAPEINEIASRRTPSPAPSSPGFSEDDVAEEDTELEPLESLQRSDSSLSRRLTSMSEFYNGYGGEDGEEEKDEEIEVAIVVDGPSDDEIEKNLASGGVAEVVEDVAGADSKSPQFTPEEMTMLDNLPAPPGAADDKEEARESEMEAERESVAEFATSQPIASPTTNESPAFTSEELAMLSNLPPPPDQDEESETEDVSGPIHTRALEKTSSPSFEIEIESPFFSSDDLAFLSPPTPPQPSEAAVVDELKPPVARPRKSSLDHSAAMRIASPSSTSPLSRDSDASPLLPRSPLRSPYAASPERIEEENQERELPSATDSLFADMREIMADGAAAASDSEADDEQPLEPSAPSSVLPLLAAPARDQSRNNSASPLTPSATTPSSSASSLGALQPLTTTRAAKDDDLFADVFAGFADLGLVVDDARYYDSMPETPESMRAGLEGETNVFDVALGAAAHNRAISGDVEAARTSAAKEIEAGDEIPAYITSAAAEQAVYYDDRAADDLAHEVLPTLVPAEEDQVVAEFTELALSAVELVAERVQSEAMELPVQTVIPARVFTLIEYPAAVELVAVGVEIAPVQIAVQVVIPVRGFNLLETSAAVELVGECVDSAATEVAVEDIIPPSEFTMLETSVAVELVAERVELAPAETAVQILIPAREFTWRETSVEVLVAECLEVAAEITVQAIIPAEKREPVDEVTVIKSPAGEEEDHVEAEIETINELANYAEPAVAREEAESPESEHFSSEELAQLSKLPLPPGDEADETEEDAVDANKASSPAAVSPTPSPSAPPPSPPPTPPPAVPTAPPAPTAEDIDDMLETLAHVVQTSAFLRASGASSSSDMKAMLSTLRTRTAELNAVMQTDAASERIVELAGVKMEMRQEMEELGDILEALEG